MQLVFIRRQQWKFPTTPPEFPKFAYNEAEKKSIDWDNCNTIFDCIQSIDLNLLSKGKASPQNKVNSKCALARGADHLQPTYFPFNPMKMNRQDRLPGECKSSVDQRYWPGDLKEMCVCLWIKLHPLRWAQKNVVHCKL